MFRTLNEILTLLLADILGRHQDEIMRRLDAIDADVEANTEALNRIAATQVSMAADLAAIKVFLGMEGQPGTVTDAQIAETLGKVQAVRNAVGNFNP